MSNEMEVARIIRCMSRKNLTIPGQQELARRLIRLIKGTCIRDDCEKYDETAPDNCGQPGVCIYHEARPEGGIRIPMEPCYEPCANAECMDQSYDTYTCQNHGICEDHIPVEQEPDLPPGACLATCHNEQCEQQEADDNVCLALAVCSSHVLLEPAASGYCCERSSCPKWASGDVCGAVKPCADQVDPQDADELQGCTLEQWQQIIEGGYLCQFAPDDFYHPDQTYLDTLNHLDHPDLGYEFYSENHGSFRNCRPAELPGVLRPWFGGDCPVDPSVKVFVKLRNGIFMHSEANYRTWSHTGPDVGGEIVAYMEVK